MISFLKRLIPSGVYKKLVAPYHLFLSFFFALLYGFPANHIKVIAVTGTKGKSSVVEMIAAVLEEAGYAVAVSSTIRFKTGTESKRNLYKMTLPGRGFIQRFLKEAVEKHCEYAVIEVTSEAAVQYRHFFLSLNALVFTNLQKEHLESHGSMEAYFQAKFCIGKELALSKKRPRAIISNSADEYGKRFLELPVEKQIPFSLEEAQHITPHASGMEFVYKDQKVTLPHPGTFSVLNALAALHAGEFFGVPLPTAAAALSKLSTIPGRAERIDAGQAFDVVVDYAHTPDSLQALYGAYEGRRKICVLGNTGGGRDTWKRPLMGTIAEGACAEVILTNEDPYDEDPQAILTDMAKEMSRSPRMIMDRREAIREALSLAQEGDVVLITGKGTDPYIMGKNGTKTPWDDRAVAREELLKLVQ